MIRPVQTEFLFAVIGNPVRHSLSPKMMNAAFKAMGAPAVYLAFEVDGMDSALETFARMGFRGLSVTIPYKEDARRLAAEVDETAAAIGAVNTLRLREDGAWEGRNTDWLGVVRSLRAASSLQGKRALVIGAGGAARAVVYGLKREGAAVVVANRTAERGVSLASAFGCEFASLGALAGRDFDVVVQSTSVGLGGRGGFDAEFDPETLFRPGVVVLDIVYSPMWTPFLLSAKNAGCTVVHGLDMLLHQGVAQLEWWLGENAPVAVMDAALRGAASH